ncbi:peptidyl-prolyl cis-trans isomerase [Geomonas sp. RF6]|uniref:peptidylprolyl isomerase n=1 Tax=Geomonas sp. RF6 TaxID=2897342 RepID=UPI001E352711|nr:peptidylprolyl isomerase [Geomonas sp. RF6]UFS72280.1 peptidyl-prolyl cis-trans isomerase [Geomonas sp. RF6]
MLKRVICTLILVLCCAGSALAIVKVKNPMLVIETSLGNIRIELFQKEAPISTENFLEYAKIGYYNGTIFHRVIPGFMIQGGGFTKDMAPKAPARPSIKNEGANGLKNDRGTLAMARTNDPDSAKAQFFINVVNNDFLNHSANNPGYAVFGKVVSGMDIVDQIAATPTGNQRGFPDVPTTPIIIKGVRIISK